MGHYYFIIGSPCHGVLLFHYRALFEHGTLFEHGALFAEIRYTLSHTYIDYACTTTCDDSSAFVFVRTCV